MSWSNCEWVEDAPEDRDLVRGSDGNLYHWPMCEVANCGNRACLRLNSLKCYPHTLPGVPIVIEEPESEPVEHP